MKLNWKKATAAVAISTSLLAGTAGLAGADGTGGVAGTGWDGVNQVLVGQGSDTTYLMMQKLSDIYNSAPGCETDNASGSATLGQCVLPPNQSKTDIKGNWDHDVATQLYPTGSSAGVKALTLGQVDFARSSRPPKTSGESTTNFFGYAKDGIAVITMAGRAKSNITTTQLQGVYNCSITKWGQITTPLDPSDDAASPTIKPYGMNTSSGTYDVFKTFLGFDPNAGTCVKKLANGDLPFENDVKQITGPGALAGDVANAPDAIWWASFAEIKTFPYKAQSAETWDVDGVEISTGSIASNSYPIKRFVYHVTLKADATPTSSGTGTGTGNMTGTSSGKGGGVREFTEFLCKPKVDHTISINTGANLFDDEGKAIAESGFQRIPAAERTNGACVTVPAP